MYPDNFEAEEKKSQVFDYRKGYWSPLLNGIFVVLTDTQTKNIVPPHTQKIKKEITVQ